MIRSKVNIRIISYLLGRISWWSRLVNSISKLFSLLTLIGLSTGHNWCKLNFIQSNHMAGTATALSSSARVKNRHQEIAKPASEHIDLTEIKADGHLCKWWRRCWTCWTSGGMAPDDLGFAKIFFWSHATANARGQRESLKVDWVTSKVRNLWSQAKGYWMRPRGLESSF